MSDPQQPYGAQPTGAPQPPAGFPQPSQGQTSQGQPGQPYPHQGQPVPSQPAPGQAQPSAAPQYPSQAPQYPGQAAQQAPHSPQFPQTQPATAGQSPQYGAAQYGGSQPSGNSLGRIAFFIAAGAVVLNLLSTLISPILFRTGSYDVAGSLSGVLAILVVLLSVAAVILALIALRGPGSKLFPAIALGAAGATFLGYALTWISNLFYLF